MSQAEANPVRNDAEVSVQVSPELRALIAQSRRQTAPTGDRDFTAQDLPQPSKTPEPVLNPEPNPELEIARPQTSSIRLKLRRDGQRPLIFNGVCVLHASSKDNGLKFFHELCLFNSDDGQIGASFTRMSELRVVERAGAILTPDPQTVRSWLADMRDNPALPVSTDQTLREHIKLDLDQLVSRLIRGMASPEQA